MKKISMLLAIGLIFWGSEEKAFSQNVKYCGSSEAIDKLLKDHPEIAAKRQEVEDLKQARIAHQIASPEAMGTIYTIPVVFHILHKYGPENISKAQVQDAVAILNRDYRKRNADTSAIATQHFKNIAADCEIEFMLAKKDPSGNCTDGIDRIVSNETYIGDDNSKLNDWNASKYLNIWVVNSISNGAAGYSYPPGVPANIDGVMILYDYVGSIGASSVSHSRALTHEVGHYLDLLHTWGGSNIPGVSCGNDFINDTPVTKGWTSCNLTTNDVCNPGTPENVQNYMEYSYCSNMFTAGQKVDMRAALTSSRPTLWSSSNLIATGTDGNGPALCSPIADFIASSKLACTNSSVTFTDLSWRGAPSSWAWSFPGGTPSSSTLAAPAISYNAPGVYSVSMVATNAIGSDQEVKTSYITIYNSAATYTLAPYFEGFEGSAVPNADWSVFNEAGVTWQQTSSTKYAGLKCIMINNMSNSSGAVDEIISPSFDITKMPGPLISFKMAYVQRTTADDDLLEVFASNDCGKTWNSRYSKSGTSLLPTTTLQTSAFYPTSVNQWRNEYVNVAPFLGSHNVMLKFKFTSDGGNNIFIDNINLNATLGIQSEDNGIEDLALFPNPAKQATTIQFVAQKQGEAVVTIVDVLGRTVAEVFNGRVQVGEQKFAVNTFTFSKGVYYVNVNFDNRMVSKALMIAE